VLTLIINAQHLSYEFCGLREAANQSNDDFGPCYSPAPMITQTYFRLFVSSLGDNVSIN
jgi:hypothetical protein